MLARRDVKRDGVFALEHDAIGAGVDPMLFGIFGDDQIVGADVAAAVFFMPARNRKGFEVDIFVDAVFKDRRVFDELGRHRLEVANLAAPRLNEIGQAEFRIGAHGDGQPRQRVDLAAENLHVLARAGDFLEQHRRRMGAAFEDHLDQAADVLVPGDIFDAAQFADFVDFVQERAQVVVGGSHRSDILEEVQIVQAVQNVQVVKTQAHWPSF